MRLQLRACGTLEPSTQTPASPTKAASAADVSKLEQGLKSTTNKEEPSKMSEADLKNEIKALNEKASRFPGLDEQEKQQLTALNSELSDRSRRPQEQSQSPSSSILDKMR